MENAVHHDGHQDVAQDMDEEAGSCHWQGNGKPEAGERQAVQHHHAGKVLLGEVEALGQPWPSQACNLHQDERQKD